MKSGIHPTCWSNYVEFDLKPAIVHNCVTQGVGPIQAARDAGWCMDFYLNLLNISMLCVGVGTSALLHYLMYYSTIIIQPFPQILDPFLNHYYIKIYKQ